MQRAHRRTSSSGHKPYIIGLILWAAAIHPAIGEPWDFSTVVDLGVIYTDNLRLAPEGLEESDYIYTIAPTFSLSTEGDRITADLRYRPEAYIFDTAPESDSIFHVVDASLTSTLVRDALFLDASATNFQTIVTPDQRIPTSNVPISGNRAESTILQARPYWQQDLGFATILAEVSYLDTRYSEVDSTQAASLQDSTERRAGFNLNNHALQRGIAWGIDYSYRRVEYEVAVPWKFQRASANLGYWANGTVRVFASGGVETAFDNPFDSSMDDSFWEAGFQYKPTQRLDLEVAAGERAYGNSYRARLNYDLRRGRTSLTYTERPSTTGGSGLGRRPLIDPDNLDDFLNRPGQSDRFISKRGQWLTTIELAKSDMSLRIFHEERFERTTATGDDVNDEEHRGAAFRWNWNLGVKSTLGFVADYSKRETEVRDATLTRFSLDYSYRFTDRLQIVAVVQRSEENARNSDDDYVENNYRLTLRAGF